MTTVYHHDQQSLFLCSVCDLEKPQIERYYANRSRFILCKTCASQGKHCSTCTDYKPFSAFSPSPRSGKRGGVSANCKICSSKKYNPIQQRAQRLKSRFGITQAEYDAMFSQQKGLCAICHQPETVMDNTGKKARALAVDHNHKTGAIRQLLCGYCNYLLGYAKDNPELLQSASDYLRKHRQH